MKESFWAVFIVSVGVIAIAVVFLFQSLTNTDEHNIHLLKETAQTAMYDAFDVGAYRLDGTIRIDREKFVENFVRRFAESAALAKSYKIEIFDVSEEPPKVSIRVTSTETGNVNNETINFNLTNQIDAILETPY